MAKYCAECGAEVKEDDKFCGKCGRGISQEVPNKERKSPEKEIDKELKKIEESVTKGTVDKELKNVEGKIPAQRGDVSIDVKEGKKKRASKEEKKTEKKPKASTKKKELRASKKEEKPTVWKESILEKTEKEMIPRTKKIAIFSSVIIIISVSLLLVVDADGDGLNNLTEIQHGTAIFNSDSDDDGLSDGDELNNYGTDPLNKDSDNDGLDDYKEINTYHTNPLDDDYDNDGLNDGDEVQAGTDLFDSDTDEWKFQDSDNDGWSDYKEYYEEGTDRFDSDTDDDGYKDGSDPHPTTHEWKLMDSDNDGWNDYKEYYEEGTDRFDSDTDDDGYMDSSDPHPTEHEWKFQDSDNDGWSDYKEYFETGTSRYNSDTDGDGAPDPRDAHPLSAARKITRQYEWDYPTDWWNKKSWTWTIEVSYDLYIYESQLDRISSWYDWPEYTLDQTVISLAVGLKNAAENDGFNYYETVDFVLAFVQSLPYTVDDVTTGANEYPRYPIETIVDGGGDCEDTSFLVAGILNEMNYDVCLILLPGHMAVGVYGSDTYSGSYYNSDGKHYYYCETTSDGWKMGQMPSYYQGKTATIIGVD